MYKVISTGSQGNAVIYGGVVLVDCGVSFKAIEAHINEIQIILLTHEHKDHININTLKKIRSERPSIRIACCEWLKPQLSEFRNIDILNIGSLYDYGSFEIMPVKLYHDVENCGFRIFINRYKIFHATDTAHLEGIEAKNYNLYAIEHNYDEERISDIIEGKKAKGEFSHLEGSQNSHLSEQQAKRFIFNNAKDNFEVLRLHESSSFK